MPNCASEAYACEIRNYSPTVMHKHFAGKIIPFKRVCCEVEFYETKGTRLFWDRPPLGPIC